MRNVRTNKMSRSEQCPRCGQKVERNKDGLAPHGVVKRGPGGVMDQMECVPEGKTAMQLALEAAGMS